MNKAYKNFVTVADNTAGPRSANYYVLTSPSCSRGSRVHLGAAAASVRRTVFASDGAVAAEVFGPVPRDAAFTFITPDGRNHRVTFSL